MYLIGDREVAAVARVINGKKTSRYLEGAQETSQFEKELAEKIGVSYAIAVNSGTSALICGLAALGVGPGDEVILPGYTFMASAVAVLAVGAIPVVCEIDETLTIDVEDVERKISERTRAIMPVHIAGFPANLESLQRVAVRHGVRIAEDACQADGGSYRGKRLGSIGAVGAFSFNHHKIMTCGEGGAVLTNDREIFERAFIEHDSGISFRPFSKEFAVALFAGRNYRGNEILSAILRVQLERLDAMLASLRSQKNYMTTRLKENDSVGVVPSHDEEGDCGVVTALSFSTSDAARRVVEYCRSRDMVGCFRPIELERHVYSQWDVVLEHCGAHHPSLNPYNMRENAGCAMAYSRDMCPNTLDYLSRAVFISNYPGETVEDYDQKLGIIEGAVKSI